MISMRQNFVHLFYVVKDRGKVVFWATNAGISFAYANEYQNILVCKLGGLRLQYQINMS
jgi:hypothetical protein